MHVIVGSKSELKLRAVHAAFQSLHIVPHAIVVEGCAAESNVDAQPFGMAMMEAGAHNRITSARIAKPGADFYVGIENGLVRWNEQHWFDVPCVVIIGSTGRESVAFGTHFPIPDWLANRVLSEKSELGVIVQELAGGGEKDPMAYLSGNNISREAILTEAVRCALLPFANPGQYAKPA